MGELPSGQKTMKSVVEKKLGEQVIAVGALTQGKAPSMVSMMTGAALIGLVRPRPSKLLPKRFLLAVTPTGSSPCAVRRSATKTATTPARSSKASAVPGRGER